MKKNGLTIFTISFCLGVICCYFAKETIFLGVYLCLFILILFMYKSYVVPLTIAFSIGGGVYWFKNRLPVNHYTHYSSSFYKVHLIKKNKTTNNKYNVFETLITDVKNDNTWLHTNGKLIAYFPKTFNPSIDETYIIQTEVRKFKPAEYDFLFDYQKFMKNKYIYRYGYIQNAKRINTENFSLFAKAQRIRAQLGDTIDKKLTNTDASALLKALTLGDKSDLKSEHLESFKRTGTMHLLAISGLHIAIYYYIIWQFFWFVEYIKYGKYIRMLICLLILIGFVFLSGANPSVIRAVLMIGIWNISKLVKRPQTAVHVVSLSALLILVFNPNYLFDVGFQLSYSAVLTIILGYKPLMQIFSPTNYLMKLYYNSFVITLLATFGTLPFSIYYFHQFPTFFLVSNLVLVPVFAIILGMGLFTFGVILLIPTASILVTPWIYICTTLLQFNQWIAGLGGFITNLSINYWVTFIVFLGNLVLLYFFNTKKKLILVLYCIIMMISGIVYYKSTQIIKQQNTIHLVNQSRNTLIIAIVQPNLYVIHTDSITSKTEQYVIQPFLQYYHIDKYKKISIHNTYRDPYLMLNYPSLLIEDKNYQIFKEKNNKITLQKLSNHFIH